MSKHPLLAQRTDSGAIVLIVVGVVVLVPVIWLIAVYNRFVKLRQTVGDSWAGIDVELKRRYDLIPNLVETVRGYATHERETLAHVVELRNRAMANTGPADRQALDERALLAGLRQLFVVAEGYPQLKADAHFRELQTQLAITEDRIAAARRFYNGNVRELNSMRLSFPTNLVAKLFGFALEPFFELSDDAERVVPRVGDSLSGAPAGG